MVTVNHPRRDSPAALPTDSKDITMKLLFKVDQKAALAQGVDAPSSTVQLEVNPETDLSSEERQIIASVLHEGFDCTRYGVSGAWGSRGRSIVLVRPTIEGLHEALAEFVEAKKAAAVEAQKEAEQRDRETREAIAQGPEPRPLYICYARENERLFVSQYNQGDVSIQGQVPRPRHANPASDEAKAEYEAYRQDCERQEQELLERLRPELVAKAQARANEQAELELKLQAQREVNKVEYAELYARLPERLRERHEEGFASDEEVREAVLAICRRDANFDPEGPPEYNQAEQLEVLTDEEFQRLKQVRAQLSEDQTAQPYEISYYRSATDEDDPDDIDSDNEVKAVDRCIVVEWHRAGLLVSARVDFQESEADFWKRANAQGF